MALSRVTDGHIAETDNNLCFELESGIIRAAATSWEKKSEDDGDRMADARL